MEMSNLEGIGDKKIQIFLNAYIIELPRLSMHLKGQEFPLRNLVGGKFSRVRKQISQFREKADCLLPFPTILQVRVTRLGDFSPNG
jgi:hypothetical protein